MGSMPGHNMGNMAGNDVVMIEDQMAHPMHIHGVQFQILELTFTQPMHHHHTSASSSIKINYPAASSGVLKELELSIFMQLFISLTLFLDVISDGVFITMLADRTSKVTICPKLATPQLFLDLGTLAKNFSGCQTLDHRYNFRD
jgi:hypothetical protein